MTEPELLTIPEVAARLRLSTRTVKRLIHDGQIRVVHPSPRRTAVTERELRAYLAYLESRAA